MSRKQIIEMCIYQGKNNKEIARFCDVSVRTVERHRKTLKESKCDSDKKYVTNVTELSNKKNKINWLRLETEYVTDISEKPVTLKKLSEKYKINFFTIQDRSTKFYWKEKRIKYQRDVMKKTRVKMDEIILKKCGMTYSEFIESMLDIVKKALLQASKELHIHEEVNSKGELISFETETVRVKKLEELINIYHMIQKIGYEEEKLEFEREKFLIKAETKKLEILKKIDTQLDIS
ncbi:MAG: LuxR C-terminal-related transcriptional regulator [Fusobacterium ulcerans]|uniref:LuxR C-terminal-related transcriptional regulator n=1 Tax=Fusobacterium ulcerans TaxID=861 RepID=UPI003A86ACF5